MAFAYTRTATFSIGRSKRMSVGTFTNGAADTGGEITTGLRFVDTFVYSCSSHVDTGALKVTKNSATVGGVTIVASDGADGDWMAIGL